MKHHILKFIAACLLPVFLLTGCWQEEPPSNHTSLLDSDEVSQNSVSNRVILPDLFSLPYVPDLTLDPITCMDGMQQMISSLLCEGLFRLGPDLEPEPWLCAQYTYAPDTFTYVFELRSDVTFSDGSPLTADDVKHTLNRARTSERYASRLSQVKSIKAGDGVLTIVLSAPNSGFPALLDIPIIKQTSEKIPIGTGPYFFSAESSGTYLIANQFWWTGTQQPTDRIALVEASDQETMLYRFTSHDVQLITADLTGTNPISATGRVTYQDADTSILQYIGCNTLREPLNNPAFRQALNMGINRSNLVHALLSGHGQPALFPISPVSPLYPDTQEERYSTSHFITALAGSGYSPETTRTLTLLVNQENSFKVSVAQQIATDYTAAGVPVAVKILPWDEYIAALVAGEFDLYYGEVKLTADWALSALVGTNGALNYGAWSDPLTDQLLTNFAASSDRPAAMEKLCQRIQGQAPILPVCFKTTSILMQSDVVTGLNPTMAEPFYNLSECKIHLRED